VWKDSGFFGSRTRIESGASAGRLDQSASSIALVDVAARVGKFEAPFSGKLFAKADQDEMMISRESITEERGEEFE
jgi:hypothetical protein